MFSGVIDFLYLVNQIWFNSWSSILFWLFIIILYWKGGNCIIIKKRSMKSITRVPVGHDQNKPIPFLMKLVHFFCNGKLLLSLVSQYYELCFSSPFFINNGRLLFSLVSQYYELWFFPIFFLIPFKVLEEMLESNVFDWVL